MRRLIIFRHAKAEKGEPAGSDFDRALTAHGQDDAARMGAYLASHKLVPQFALVSPAKRTQQTWATVAAQLPKKPRSNDDPRIYNAMPDALLAVIATAPQTAQAVMLVGHNPGLHEIALHLTATGDVDTRESLREGLPTCGLIVIDFAFEDWSGIAHGRGRLDRFVHPSILQSKQDF